MERQYQILVELTSSGLEKKVCEKLDEGWILHGGPFSNGDYSFCQAIIFPNFENHPMIQNVKAHTIKQKELTFLATESGGKIINFENDPTELR